MAPLEPCISVCIQWKPMRHYSPIPAPNSYRSLTIHTSQEGKAQSDSYYLIPGSQTRRKVSGQGLNHLKHVIRDLWAPCFGCKFINTVMDISNKEKVETIPNVQVGRDFCKYYCIFPHKISVNFKDGDIEAPRDKLPKATQLLIMEPGFQVQGLCFSWFPPAAVGTSLQQSTSHMDVIIYLKLCLPHQFLNASFC